MENQEVRHYQINGQFKMVIERAASTKGTLGYKVEANGDSVGDVIANAYAMKAEAEKIAGASIVEPAK